MTAQNMGQAFRDVDAGPEALPRIPVHDAALLALRFRDLQKFHYRTSISFAMVQFLSNDFHM